jgi:Recombination endonuclease VII
MSLYVLCKNCGKDSRNFSLGWCKSCYVKNTDLNRRYGISLADFHEMLRLQGNKCLLCQVEFKLGQKREIDHCHATDQVRGILCSRCNRMLGALETSGLSWERIKAYFAGLIRCTPNGCVSTY